MMDCRSLLLPYALAALVIWAPHAIAADPLLPNSTLTPGAVLTSNTSVICRSGYTKTVRHTSGQLKHEVYKEYGIDPRGGHYEVDHLIPLELGGADERENLWPQSYDTEPWNAHVKDKLESFLHREVCAGRMKIEEAQGMISTDWISAYKALLGDP